MKTNNQTDNVLGCFGKFSLVFDKCIPLVSGISLKCYNDGEEQIVKCDENLGYRTCFIRYNESEYRFSIWIFSNMNLEQDNGGECSAWEEFQL